VKLSCLNANVSIGRHIKNKNTMLFTAQGLAANKSPL